MWCATSKSLIFARKCWKLLHQPFSYLIIPITFFKMRFPTLYIIGSLASTAASMSLGMFCLSKGYTCRNQIWQCSEGSPTVGMVKTCSKGTTCSIMYGLAVCAEISPIY
ncbi:uncharacterized protein BO66DRAFT_198302 [Aspergillus aculeatinus CBS 121060]|uniref:Uncharacterized protein n=1 Tax=Aspergillus aculeatinus CBS 121060 TaxID=1448322 RepID=A0ACD1GWG7_9EURO|nr:hypothetical protein BO66DRAFT_198302 [Aspergillus aculeatinus CBS 121060]RAH65684.1 hypothetical protein BO66DRAFT_198302 [Aspergillus aculeatinus CBS 121060]